MALHLNTFTYQCIQLHLGRFFKPRLGTFPLMYIVRPPSLSPSSLHQNSSYTTLHIGTYVCQGTVPNTLNAFAVVNHIYESKEFFPDQQRFPAHILVCYSKASSAEESESQTVLRNDSGSDLV